MSQPLDGAMEFLTAVPDASRLHAGGQRIATRATTALRRAGRPGKVTVEVTPTGIRLRYDKAHARLMHSVIHAERWRVVDEGS